MVAKSGDILLRPDAIAAIRDRLVPMATIITPNLPEAAVLLDTDAPDTLEGMRAMLPELHALGARWIMLKGGSLPETVSKDSTDFLSGDGKITMLTAPRIRTNNLHGTGCTLSAAIAALMTRMPLPGSVAAAKTVPDGRAASLDIPQCRTRTRPGPSFPCVLEMISQKARSGDMRRFR